MDDVRPHLTVQLDWDGRIACLRNQRTLFPADTPELLNCERDMWRVFKLTCDAVILDGRASVEGWLDIFSDV
jgi:hypothetical protein